MPPYAATQQQHNDFAQVLNGTNYDSDTMVDIPLTPNRAIHHHPAKVARPSWDTTTKSVLPTPPPPPLPEDEDEQQEQQMVPKDDDDAKTPGVLGKMLDFNPCAAKIPNPHSALFKERRCAECGSKVYKYRNGGYETEIVVKQQEQQQPEEEEETHNNDDNHVSMPALADEATVLSDDDDDDGDNKSCHSDGSSSSSCCGRSHKSSETAVSDVTTNKTTGVETKIYFMKSCYIKRQNRKAHRENGYGLVMVDLLDYFAQKAEHERLALEEDERQKRAAEEQAEMEEAERLQASALAAKKERSLKGRTKKVLRSVKKSFSFKACFSSSAVATAAATPKIQPQPRSVVQLSWGDNHEEQTVGDDDSNSDSNEEEQQQPQEEEELPLIRRALPEELPEDPHRPVQLSWGGNVEKAEPQRPVQLSWGGQAENIDDSNMLYGSL